MRNTPVKLRITVALVCLLISVLLLAASLGLVPDRQTAVLEGRTKLCEALAICSSVLVTRGDTERLQSALQVIVARNGSIISAGVRKDKGKLLANVGDHAANWQGTEINDSNVLVPVWAGDKKWGSVEIMFQPVAEKGLLGFIMAPTMRLVIFVSVASFLLYLFYLSRMLQYLDPSKVVPQRVRAALDTLAEGLLLMDNRERIVLANHAFAAHLGIPPEKLQGRRASAIPWTNQQDCEQLPWLRAIEKKQSQNGVLLSLTDTMGYLRTFMVNSSPVLGETGTLRGVLASFEDVSVIEENKAKLKEAKDAAEAASNAKGQFLARMSHEIRTPMNAILGFTDVLRRNLEENEKARQDYLNTIHASGKHLLDVINDVLDLSKIESGHLEIELSRFSPYQLMSEVVAILRVKAEEKGITLNCRTAGLIPETILSDAMRLRQVLMNLIGNAIKFTETGGVEIVARLLRTSETPQLAFDVIDTGIGMKPEVLDKIFDPFVQGDSSITRKFGGTGLGLAISRQFAKAMGGQLTVKSELGKGSVFMATVSTGQLDGIRLFDPSTEHLAIEKDAKGAKPLKQLRHARVLLVEDGESNRKLVTLVLRRAGVEVDTAVNGQAGVDLATNRNYDLILMDMQMPVMDGYMATSLLRERGFMIPIIALTAHGMKGEEEKCRAAGCAGFLTKPIDLDGLVETLAQQLEEASAHNEAADFPAQPPPEPQQTKTTVHGQDTESAIVSSLPADDPEFCEIIDEFVERLGQKIDLMRKALEQRNLEELAKLAHWLKGSGGTAGFSVLTNPARDLELLAKEGEIGNIKSAFSTIEQMARRIVVPLAKAHVGEQ